MKLLVYCWGSVSEPLFCEALKTLDIAYVEYAKKVTNYTYDAEFAQEMIGIIHGEGIGTVFSYDYFPMIAMLCEINKIPYVSWIYDCPQYTLQSKTLVSPYNYIYCFDRAFTQRLRALGAVHCEHYPLAGDKRMLDRAMRKAAGGIGFTASQQRQMQKEKEAALEQTYSCDVSFIGNLYNEEKNRLRKVLGTSQEAPAMQKERLSPYASGCVEGLAQAQQLVYGYNFLRESLQGQPEVVKELVEKCQLSLGTEYMRDDLQMAADVLGMEVSAREREAVLKTISEYYPVRLYTSSKLPETLRNGHLEVMGYADYEKDLPLIYHYSKINLNITSKTIETGIPQRIFDILSCGGFCLTNYQPEVAEYFEDGKELAMYVSMEDLLAKVTYYLEHEAERKQIAENGRKKVEEYFGLAERVRGMLDTTFRYLEATEEAEAKIRRRELKKYINDCLMLGEKVKAKEALLKNKKLVKGDNDLANMYYLSPVCDKEAGKGEITVYKGSVEETVEPFYELQRRLRRLEWWEDYDRQDVLDYLIEKELSVYELQWAVETTCVDKENVWRLLGE